MMIMRTYDQSFRHCVEWSDFGDEAGRVLAVSYGEEGEFAPLGPEEEGESQNEGFQPPPEAPGLVVNGSAANISFSQGAFAAEQPSQNQGFQPPQPPQPPAPAPVVQAQPQGLWQGGFQDPRPQPQTNGGAQNHGFQPLQKPAPAGFQQGGFHDDSAVQDAEESQNRGFQDDPAQAPPPPAVVAGAQQDEEAQHQGFDDDDEAKPVPLPERQKKGLVNGAAGKKVVPPQQQTGSRMRVTMMNGFF